MSFSSAMLFEFEPTDDYVFILKLWHIAKKFIQFLCYKKMCFFPVQKYLHLMKMESTKNLPLFT